MSTTTGSAIAIRDEQDEFDDRQVAILRNLGVEKANRGDLALFFHVCKRTGLDPFARQIYMIERYSKDGPKQSIQTGIDGFRLVAQRTAERTGETFGYEDTLWADSSGVWHDLWMGDTPPVAAKVAVIRNGQRFPAVALMSEYAQTKRDGTYTQMWATKGALMLAKCAEAAALRKAFPLDLSGLYTVDEVPQDERPAPVKAQGMDAVRAAVAPEPEPTPEPVEEVHDAEVVDERPLTANTRKKMFALLSEIDPDATPDTQRAGMAAVLGRPIASRSELTEDDALKVIDVLNAEKRKRAIAAEQAGG